MTSPTPGPVLTWYYDYSSPYTYLASTRIEGLCRRYGARLEWKPILVGGIFNAANQSVYESRNTPAKVRYGAKDVADWARYYGVPFRFPSIFPINSVKALRGAFLAIEAGVVSAWSHRVFRAYWAEDRDIADDAVLAEIAAASRLDPERLLAWVASEEARERLRAVTQEAIDRGVFGSPTFFLKSDSLGPRSAGDVASDSLGPRSAGDLGDQDMYFGNDRLVLLEDALRRASLRDPRRPVIRLDPADRKKEGPEGPSLPFLEDEV